MLRKLVIAEARLWASLYTWIRRRPLGPDAFPYHARSHAGLHMGLTLLLAPVAIGLVEWLLPWPSIRLICFALIFLTFVWSVMRVATMRSLPHRLDADALVLRHGIRAEARIPFEGIATVKVDLARVPRPGDGLFLADDAAYLAIAGETNLVVELQASMPIETLLARTPPVKRIHFLTDEPKRLLERLRSILEGLKAEDSVSSGK